MAATTASIATCPGRIGALGEAVGFGVSVLVVPGRGCGGGAGHVVGAVESAGDEIGVEALKFPVDQGESRADNWNRSVSKDVNEC